MTVALLSNAPADPATLFTEEADDLFAEAKNWLDGEPIETEAQATAVSSLLSRLRRVSNDADDARKLEKKPHDDAAKAVQTRWKPILDKCDLAAKTAKEALAPYLRMVEERLARDAAILRENAAKLAEEAATARQSAYGNLGNTEMSEALLKAAGEASKEAARADKQKAHAKGGERAVGLRSVWTAALTDPVEALKYYREHQADALKAWLTDQAERDVRAGARSIPGFTVSESRVAV